MTLREIEEFLDRRENMGDMADYTTDGGFEMLSLHEQGQCGEVGPCPYCVEEEPCSGCGKTGDSGILRTDDGPVPLCYSCFLEGLEEAARDRKARESTPAAGE